MSKNIDKKIEALKKTYIGKSYVYLGADIPHLVTHGTIFNNGIPSELEQKIEENAFLGSLLVEVNKIHEVVKEINKKGSLMNILYEKSKGL